MGCPWIIQPIFVLNQALAVKVDTTITWTSLGIRVLVRYSHTRTVKVLPELCLIVYHDEPRLLIDATIPIFFKLIFNTKELLMHRLISCVSSIHQMLLS